MLAMILVKITDDLNGARVLVTGHANYALKGKDIVCSAVSTLVQHTIYNAESYVKSNEDGNYNVLLILLIEIRMSYSKALSVLSSS